MKFHLLIFLLFFPSKLLELAYKTDTHTSKDYLKSVIPLIRKKYFETLISVFIIWGIALITSYIINNFEVIFIDMLSTIRVISISIIAWAVMSRLGSDERTISGNTIPEQANDYTFKFFYIIGFAGTLCTFLIKT